MVVQLHGDLRAVGRRPGDLRPGERAGGAATWSPPPARRARARAVHTSTFDVFHAETGGTVSEAGLADYPKGTAVRALQAARRGAGAGRGRGRDRGRDRQPRRRLRPRSLGGRRHRRRSFPTRSAPPAGAAARRADARPSSTTSPSGHLAAFERGRPRERYILADGFATGREIVAAAVDEAGRGWVPPTLPPRVAATLAAGGEALARVIRRPPLLGRGQLTSCSGRPAPTTRGPRGARRRVPALGAGDPRDGRAGWSRRAGSEPADVPLG